MEIRLNLERHCIETGARLKNEALIRSYFRSPNQELDHKIRALTFFLETADFLDLRNRVEPLKGDNGYRVRLVFSDDLTGIKLFLGSICIPISLNAKKGHGNAP